MLSVEQTYEKAIAMFQEELLTQANEGLEVLSIMSENLRGFFCGSSVYIRQESNRP